jgi:hypothetical protein
VSVGAELAERVVVERVKDLVAELNSTATKSTRVDEAMREYEDRARALDAAVEAFSGLVDVPSAKRKLDELHEALGQAADRLAQEQSAEPVMITINAAADWDELSFDEQRGVLKAVIEKVVVRPGRRGYVDPDRLEVTART